MVVFDETIRISVKTPAYLYDLDRIEANAASYKRLAPDQVRILYATMANPRREVIAAVSKTGFGMFVNSLPHLKLTLECGVQPGDIVFAGSGHSPRLMQQIAASGVDYHADSAGQLTQYLEHAPRGRVGLRVNVGSLLGIKTEQDPAPRLGLSREELDEVIDLYRERISTLHVYVGTNLTEHTMHCRCLAGLLELADRYHDITDLDLGGGFAFAPEDKRDAGMWTEVLNMWARRAASTGRRRRLTIEPGRSVVRTGGALFVSVTDVKHREGHRYILVDTSGTWFPRKIVHGYDEPDVVVVGRENDPPVGAVTVCGSTTFSRDFLTDAVLPKVKPGDMLCFYSAGAYNEAMHMDFLGIEKPQILFRQAGKTWAE